MNLRSHISLICVMTIFCHQTFVLSSTDLDLMRLNDGNQTTQTLSSPLSSKIDDQKVPKNKNETIISQILKSIPSPSSSANQAQRRSYDDDQDESEQQSQSFIKSWIPKSPFKKPIKKIFRSWFEPDPEALDDDSTSSTYYFTRSKAPAATAYLKHQQYQKYGKQRTVYHHKPMPRDPMLTSASSSVKSSRPFAPMNYNYNNKFMPSPYAHDNQIPQVSNRQFSIGDPANGRGVTLSFGDNEVPESSSYSAQAVPQNNYAAYPATSDTSGGSGGVGGGRGLSLSFGGGGGGGGGGSGMSFNIGRGADGRGMSLSFGRGSPGGGGGGGSGISFSFGGGGQPYAQSGSSNYPSYSSSSSYQSSGYGINYGSNYNNYDYYQPVFSMVMPSSGKKVVEYNQHPSKMKMKINSSPKVKITTNTKDPLEKPGLDEEVIQEDIFGPPEPFDKPNRTQTTNNETMNANNMTNNFNQSALFPYPPFYPTYLPPYPPSYYQYPYNYYQSYYQQQAQQQPQQQPQHHYPYNNHHQYMTNMTATAHQQQLQPHHAQPQTPPHQPYYPQSQQPQYPSYSQYAASTVTMQKSPKPPSQPTAQPQQSFAMPVSASYSMMKPQTSSPSASTIYGSTIGTGPMKPSSFKPIQQPQTPQTPPQTYWPSNSHQPQMMNFNTNKQTNSPYSMKPLTIIDNNHISNPMNGYKRSSASRNYQKDMLTLNSLSPKTAKSLNNPQPKSITVKKTLPLTSPLNQRLQPQQQPKQLHSMKRINNPNKYYGYDVMHTSESQMSTNVQGKTAGGQGVGYSFFNNGTFMGFNNPMMTNNNSSSNYWNAYNYYYNPYYYNYYNNYYQYARKYYEHYYYTMMMNMMKMNGHNNATLMMMMLNNGTQMAAMLNDTKSMNHNRKYYPRNITSITGFSQNSFDYEQSKRFGHRIIQHQGGSTKEEKARVILDIRPRVTIKMLNKTEQAMQDEELRKKKKDHIFKTHMEIIMDSTTTSTPKPYYSYYDKYYGYNYYGPEVDDFGWTHEPPYETSTTPRPKTTTTTRRRTTTTTEAPSSSEVSEEETSESTSGETSTEESDNQSSTSSTTTEATESSSGEDVEESSSGESSTSSSTTTEPSTMSESNEIDGDDEIIDGQDNNDDTTDDKSSEVVDENEDNDNDNNDNNDNQSNNGNTVIDAQQVANNNVTVSPELIQAMIKALQEALGVTTTMPTSISTTPTSTTPDSLIDGFDDVDDEGFDEPKTTDDTGGNGDDDQRNTDDESETEQENENDIDDDNDNGVSTTPLTTPATLGPFATKSRPTTRPLKSPSKAIKGGIGESTGLRRRLPTNVITTTVRNVTQLRLKTPVLSMQSRSTTTLAPMKSRATGKPNKRSPAKSSTTTTPSSILIVNNKKLSSSKDADSMKMSTIQPQIIDGDALLNKFDINNLTDDERREMLTNIFDVIQRTTTNNSIEQPSNRSTKKGSSKRMTTTKKKSSKTTNNKRKTTTSSASTTSLLPVRKANNVRIISSLDELNQQQQNIDKSSINKPIYVVLLPQKKK